MIRLSGKVLYQDGRAVEFDGGISALSKWEQYAQRNKLDPDPQKTPMTWTLYVAFASLGEKAGKGIGFEAWKDTVEDIDLEVKDANPTPQDTSAD